MRLCGHLFQIHINEEKKKINKFVKGELSHAHTSHKLPMMSIRSFSNFAILRILTFFFMIVANDDKIVGQSGHFLAVKWNYAELQMLVMTPNVAGWKSVTNRMVNMGPQFDVSQLQASFR